MNVRKTAVTKTEIEFESPSTGSVFIVLNSGSTQFSKHKNKEITF